MPPDSTMSTGRWLRALALTVLVAAACSANPTAGAQTPSAPDASPVASESPSPVATASPVATSHTTPKATPRQPSPNPCPPVKTPPLTPTVRSLALVFLRGSYCTVVRDITDISHPKTDAVYDQLSQPQFLGETLLSYVDGNSLFHMRVDGSQKTRVVTPSTGVSAYAWSPDRSTVAYLTQNSSGMFLHLVSGGKDRVVGGAMPALPAVGCESLSSTCADNWEFRLSYSPDGAFISLVDNIVKPVFRVWTSGGTVVTSVDSQPYTMSAWSGAGLYFRDAKGVEVWRNGVISSFLPGVTWIGPKASPKGGQIVYEKRDSGGSSHVYMVAIASKQIRELKKSRFGPAFLTSRFIWYQGLRACTAADGCPAGYPEIPNGKTYIYDLLGGSETESVITQVWDIWPHADCVIRAECYLANLS